MTEPDVTVLSCFTTNGYHLERFLTRGISGTVYLVRSSTTGHLMAAKVIINAKTDAHFLTNELAIAPGLNHKHVIKTIATFSVPVQQPLYSILVSEFANGGDLMAAMPPKGRPFDMLLHRRYFRDCTKGLAYLHSLGIGHRDVKADNVLLTRNANQAVAKLADFGFAVLFRHNDKVKKTKDFCGTLGYMAPEILMQRDFYNPAMSDCFSLGVLLYLLTIGLYPFGDGKDQDLDTYVQRQLPVMVKGPSLTCDRNGHQPDRSLKDLITSLLSLCPLRRMTAPEVLANRWLQG